MNEAMSQGKRGLSRRRVVLIAAACLCLLAAGIVYYQLFSWRSGYFAAGRGLTPEGNPWIGAEEPELTIHEYVDYECPHCPAAHQWLRRVLVLHQGDVRLVRHDFARMRCTAGVKGRKPHSCELARGGICAGEQGKFWEWNDAVMSNPRPLTNPGRDPYTDETARAIGLDVAAFEACLTAPKTIERALATYEEAHAKGITETPTYVVDGKKLDTVELSDLLDERL
jgi:protein-disulfide isomerase